MENSSMAPNDGTQDAPATQIAKLPPNANLSVAKKFGSFDTTALSKASKKKKVTIDDAASAILDLHHAIMLYAFCRIIGEYKAGRFLLMIKSMKPHGHFVPWVQATFGEFFGLRTAQRYMATCLRIDAAMPRFRNALKQSRPELNVDELDNEQLVELLPEEVLSQLSDAFEGDSKAIPTTTQESHALNPRFAVCVNNFMATEFVVTSVELMPGEIDAPQIVISEEQAIDQQDWPACVFLLATSKRAVGYAKTLLAAHESGRPQECVLLLPAAAVNGLSNSPLLRLPQLIFTGAVPLAQTQKTKSLMTMLLLSDADRVADFAHAFHEFGFVKIPFSPSGSMGSSSLEISDAHSPA